MVRRFIHPIYLELMIYLLLLNGTQIRQIVRIKSD
nr:MAG TPA: hypothetical protein [Caudoviricetes sp.]